MKYKSGQEDLIDHVSIYRSKEKADQSSKEKKASYGFDSPFGMIASFPLTPLYAYATVKGKFSAWDGLLKKHVTKEELQSPSLDAGCGRGMVLIKIAKLKKEQNCTSKTYGIDIFSTADQTGNSPEATCLNIASENLLEDDQVVLHSASFCDLPFEDDQFGLVTSSLALHNPTDKQDRVKAVEELARVTKPGGKIILIDLAGFSTTKLYEKTLKDLGWKDVQLQFSGLGLMFGIWFCQTIIARKPIEG